MNYTVHMMINAVGKKDKQIFKMKIFKHIGVGICRLFLIQVESLLVPGMMTDYIFIAS